MARIPTGEELGVRRSGAASFSTSVPNIQLDAQQGLGKTQEMVDLERERMDNQELATAEMQFQIASLHEDEKYNQDEDIDTIEDRYGAAMSEQLGKAAQNITNGEVRQVFMEKNGVNVEKSKFIMAGKVFKRKADRERGYMANAFATIVEGAKNLEHGNVQDGVVAIQLATDSMVERGVMTNVEAQATLQQSQHDMALGRLKSMTPEQQLATLDEPWVDYLPAETVAGLRMEAERDAMDQVALTEAKALSGMDLREGLAEIEAKYADDEDMYQKTRTQFLLEKQDQSIALDEKQTGYYEDIVPAILDGAKITDYDLDQYELSAAQRTNLYKLEDYAAARSAGDELVKYSDDTVVRQMESLLMNNDKAAARNLLTTRSADLTVQDVRFYRHALSKTTEPIEADTLLTSRMVMNQYIKDKKVDEAGAKAIRQEVDRKTKQYLIDNQKNPPDEMRQQWIEEEFLTIKQKDKWAWIDEESYLYQLPKERRDTVVGQMDFIQEATGMNRTAVGETMEAYTSKYEDFTEEMDEALYILRTNPETKDQSPTAHWQIIKEILGIEQPAAEQPTRNARGQGARIQWAD